MEKLFKKFKFIFIYGMIVLLLFLLLYVGLLPITIYSGSFRFWLIVLPALLLVPFVIKYQRVYNQFNTNMNVTIDRSQFKKVKYVLYLIGLLILAFIIMGLSTWPILGSSRYRELIDVNESQGFTQNIKNISETKVPIIDKDLAFRLGEKTLGKYKGYGSQFTIDNYTLIDMNGELYWVGALEYIDFFKWLNNKDEGVPGYIKINATDTSDVELVKFPMTYVPSAYFGQDLMRRMYFQGNMTKLFDDYTAFELDDEGNPHYVKAVLSKKFAYTKGDVVEGIVICDAVTGEVNYYDVDDAPDWVDRIQPTDMIIQQLDYYGKYIHGYFNTLFAKKEVLQVSEGYSYVYNNGEFFLYTGMTSVGADESIVGFILTNMRTKETTFYHIGGATEFAAQNSAQGAVQDLGYQATWPILVNYNNIPTYFMTLKDDEGLIKKFAYVSVKDYSVYGIGSTLIEAQNNYRENLRASNNNPNIGTDPITITSNIVRIAEVSGTSNYYFILENDLTIGYIVSTSVNFEIPLTEVGDTVTITIYEDSNTNIYTVESFDNLEMNIVEE